MNPRPPTPAAAQARRCLAFSLMELLLAMGIMTVLIGALYGMFHHTQKALRANVTQVDVLEAGRATMSVLTLDLEQTAPSRLRFETNLYVSMSPLLLLPRDTARQKAMYYETNPPPDFSGYKPVVQTLMAGGATRTNVLSEVYLLSRVGERFVGTSYRVINVANGIGTLARYSRELPVRLMTYGHLSSNVLTAPASSYAQLADGVIHFRLQAYDGDGAEMSYDATNRYTNRLQYPNLLLGTNTFLFRDRSPTETTFLFVSNTLPTYVELELGLLEAKTYEQFKAFAAGSVQAQRFLSNHAAQVHLFRQRIAIRQAPFIQAVHP